MDIVTATLPGVLLLKPKVFGDARGFFLETWHERRYSDTGITLPFVQDNCSYSAKGVLRGLHFQKKRPQGKLIQVMQGSVYDVVADIRQGSVTFGQYYGVELTGDNHWQLWIPPGYAHGFMVTSETALLHYKVTDFYCPDDEGAIRWDDPRLSIDWPCKTPTLSAKDAAAPYLYEIDCNTA